MQAAVNASTNPTLTGYFNTWITDESNGNMATGVTDVQNIDNFCGINT